MLGPIYDGFVVERVRSCYYSLWNVPELPGRPIPGRYCFPVAPLPFKPGLIYLASLNYTTAERQFDVPAFGERPFNRFTNPRPWFSGRCSDPFPVREEGGDLDGGGVQDQNAHGGGDLDGADVHTCPGHITACDPPFIQKWLVADWTLIGGSSPGSGRLTLHFTPGGFDYWKTSDPTGLSFLTLIRLYCNFGAWIIEAFGPGDGIFAGTVALTPHPVTWQQVFKIGWIPTGGNLFITLREATTCLPVPVRGGDLDSGSAEPGIDYPGVDVCSGGAAPAHPFSGGDLDSGGARDVPLSGGGDVDSGHPSRADFPGGGDVDSGHLSRTDFLQDGGGDLDGGDLVDTVNPVGGDLDGGGASDAQHLAGGELDSGDAAGVVTVGCTPPFVPRFLYIDVTNPNASGIPSGTYPLTLGILGSTAFTYNYPPSPSTEPFLQFECTEPIDQWSMTVNQSPFSPAIQFTPTATFPPFSCGPYVMAVPFWGVLNCTFLIHE